MSRHATIFDAAPTVMPASQLKPLAVNAVEAARLLGISVATLHTLVKRGEVVGKQIMGRKSKWIFSVAALEHYLKGGDTGQADNGDEA
jgi:hypothetical protein